MRSAPSRFMIVALYGVLLSSFPLFASLQKPQTVPVVLHGKIVYPEGYHALKYVLINQGIIQTITDESPAGLPEETVYIYTNGYIYPGLLDLHTHITYNILPIWEGAQSQFTNRYEWRDNADYKEKFRPIYNALSSKETDPEFYNGLILFDELQAVAGGTTLVQQSGSIDQNVNDLAQRMVVRGTGYPEDLGLEPGKSIMAAIDLFAVRKTMGPKPDDRVWERFVEKRTAGKLQAFMPHVAEGRTGFMNEDGFDQYSRDEFEAFMSHPAFLDSESVPNKPPMALIHASGINPYDPRHINFMHEWNAGIVWSPVSNLLLYGDTLDVETLLNEGVLIALGSDWSPSGSKHVLDEARMAKFYLSTLDSDVTNEEIYQMMTVNAAKMIGHPYLGAIKEGNFADLFILDDPNSPEIDGMEALFNTSV